MTITIFSVQNNSSNEDKMDQLSKIEKKIIQYTPTYIKVSLFPQKNFRNYKNNFPERKQKIFLNIHELYFSD